MNRKDRRAAIARSRAEQAMPVDLGELTAEASRALRQGQSAKAEELCARTLAIASAHVVTDTFASAGGVSIGSPTSGTGVDGGASRSWAGFAGCCASAERASADEATTAVSIVVTAARPAAVVGKKLEHEVEQLHRFSRFRVRHQSNRPRFRLDVLGYHRDR